MPTIQDLLDISKFHRIAGRSDGACFGVSDPCFLRPAFEQVIPSVITRKYEVGSRVTYTQKTSIHKGALSHGSVCNATVIAAFGGDGSPQWPTYRLLLDEVWSADRCKAKAGQPIVVGNITEMYLSPLKQ